MKSLSLETLAALPPGIRRPAYGPGGVRIGIVHLGIGAFHRAHQAIYTDDAIAQAGGAWGICGVSLRRTFRMKWWITSRLIRRLPSWRWWEKTCAARQGLRAVPSMRWAVRA